VIVTVTSVVVVLSLSGVPELTDHQRAQLAVAVDNDDVFDGPAIIPLLRNATLWTLPIDARGATLPDYANIVEVPASRRGRLYLVEGRLARVVATAPLVRSGPWDGHLREWDVVVEQEGSRFTAVLFLVAPGDPPRTGSNVAVVARFYKIMKRKDVRQGAWTDFPVFVGHSGHVQGRPRSQSPGNVLPGGLVVLVIGLLAGYVLVRRMAVVRRVQTPGKRSEHGLAGSYEDEVKPSEPSLPTDTVNALRVIRDRVERKERRDAIDGRGEDRTS